MLVCDGCGATVAQPFPIGCEGGGVVFPLPAGWSYIGDDHYCRQCRGPAELLGERQRGPRGSLAGAFLRRRRP